MCANAGRSNRARLLADDNESVNTSNDQVINLVMLLSGVLAYGDNYLDIGICGLNLLFGKLSRRNDATRPAVICSS